MPSTKQVRVPQACPHCGVTVPLRYADLCLANGRRFSVWLDCPHCGARIGLPALAEAFSLLLTFAIFVGAAGLLSAISGDPHSAWLWLSLPITYWLSGFPRWLFLRLGGEFIEEQHIL